MPKVLITREIHSAGVRLLQKYKDLELDYRQGDPLKPAELKKAAETADAIIPVIPDHITKEIIENSKNLKVIATYSVGYDNVDIEAATKRGVYVANTPGDLTQSVAEHSLALMMAVGRRICEADRYCRADKYKFWDPMLMIGPSFAQKTLGIIGFGRIGQYFAKIAKMGLDMNIIYTDPKQHLETEGLLDAKRVELNELLEKSDVISIHCNLCAETCGLIGEKEFRKMKPLAILINTARGQVVEEVSLVAALKEGIILGAGLDVYENEPNIHPDLKKLDNVVLTPHIASATHEARIQMSLMCAENVIDVLVDKKPPRYLVNASSII